jgi:hypothetical protein
MRCPRCLGSMITTHLHELGPLDIVASFREFAVSKEAKDIIEEMYVAYIGPDNEAHAVHSSMRDK